jgi:group I intron endonuclease
MMGIYKITNPNGKIYIGQTTNWLKRYNNYKKYNCKYQTKLYNSLKFYKFENHIFEVIEECEESELNIKERYYQDLYNSSNKQHLNCRLTSTDDKSGKLSEETKLKLSKSRKGKYCGVDNHMFGKFGEKHQWFGKKHTENAKLNISEKQKGNLNHMYDKKYDLNPNSKKVINVETDEIINSIKELSEILQIKYSYLRSMISGNCKNKTKYIYYEEDKYKDEI